MTSTGSPFVTTTDKTGSRGGIQTGNVSLAEYEAPESGVLLRTEAGIEFAPTDNDIPRITPEGVVVSHETAEQILLETVGLGLTFRAEEFPSEDDLADPDENEETV